MFEAEVITSRQNKKLTMLSGLEDRKRRDAEKMFRYDGIKLFCEGVSCGVQNEYVFLKESRAGMIAERCRELGTERIEDCCGKLVLVKDDIFDKISSEKSPEGIICVAKYIDKFHKIIKINKREIISEDGDACSIPREASIIMLESVRDPGNLGTVIRSAFALGVDCIIMSHDCADIYNSKTVRAAMGALFRLPIYRTSDLEGVINVMKGTGRRFLATALNTNAVPLCDAGLKHDDVIIIGNEGHGMSENILRSADMCVYIPMTEGAESLNAAMAATICIYELGRCK